MYVNTVVKLAPGIDIIERLVLSLLIFIYSGCSMLILLSDKLSDEIYLDLFSSFNVYCVSVLW